MVSQWVVQALRLLQCIAVSCGCSEYHQALAPPNPMVAPVKPHMLSRPSVSHRCSNVRERHHALDAHTTNFDIAAISRFTHFWLFLVHFSFEKKYGDQKTGHSL